jgi:hypothetical protein
MMDPAHWLVLLWTGIIFNVLGGVWFAQIVVYPVPAKVGAEEYVSYHNYYSSRIPLRFILPGFASFLVPVALVFFGPDSVPTWLTLASAACGLVGLAVTVVLEIARHARLERGSKQDKAIGELVRYNWSCVLSITGSALLTLLMLPAAFSRV